MLGDVRCHGVHDGTGKRGLTDHLLNLRVLCGGHVDGDVRRMILIEERLDGLLLEDGHVFADGVFRLDVIGQLDDVISVLDAEHLQHLPVQLAHVIELRCLL